jgi:ribonucleotide reductase alpha subunit
MMKTTRHKLCVKKRNGDLIPVRVDNITDRINELCEIHPPLDNTIDPFQVTQLVVSQIHDGISTSLIDSFTADICASKITEHHHYGILASRLIIDDHHKTLLKTTGLKYSEVLNELQKNIDQLSEPCPIIAKYIEDFVKEHTEFIDNIIDIKRDFLLDFFGFKTLYRSYLLKVNGKSVVECPQHMFLRVALGLHIQKPSEHSSANIETIKKRIVETYNLLSLKYYTHATPTLFNAGTQYPNFVSCFLLGIDDSVEGIFKCLGDAAKISKWSGGIGIHISNIRARGSYIRKTSGKSDGVVPMLKVFNDTARYINQSGKRLGSIAMYMEPWHADVFDFLDCKVPHGDQDLKSKDLFYALWVSDNFMHAVNNNEPWYLMCPSECPGLTDVNNEEFNVLYNRYVDENKYKKKINARDLWNKIITTQIETGIPYIGFKDAVNRKSNQKNLGTIKSSNLCVGPKTRILTDKGYQVIKDLEDQEVNVWNGTQWSKTTVRKTGENQKLITITLSNGSVIDCTGYHKFYIYDDNNKEIEVRAMDLIPGNQLIHFKLPTKTFQRPLDISSSTQTSTLIIDKYLETCEEKTSNTHYIDIMLHLQTYGYYSKLIRDVPGVSLKTDHLYVHDKEGNDYNNNNFLVFNRNYEHTSGYVPSNKLGCPHIYVVSVADNNIVSDTYCFNEPLQHKGMFEGVLLGNCIEINEYSDSQKYACCVLSSIVLPTYVVEKDSSKVEKDSSREMVFDHQKLFEVTRVIVRNLDRIIDINFYPTPETERSNMSERPLGIGVQGLADVFFKMKIPYDSEEAAQLNKEIFETIYFAAVTESNELAKELGTYPSYANSPISQGLFQFDLWNEVEYKLSGRWDFESLRKSILTHGVRNSLLTALMPTATTSQIMATTVEAFEPITSNIYTRRTLAGEFIIINNNLMSHLMSLGLWNKSIRDKIIAKKGSVAGISEIPVEIQNIYKTCWEIKQKVLIDMSADRGIFVDQSQSLNLFFENPEFNKLSSALIYSWKKGLKTGSYYIRAKAASDAIDFQQTTTTVEKVNEVCDTCSS